ncbi:FT-interacting protein 1 [Vigna radiata var. radiata]|uniref:FT-interacting protein 1 n=1 Tax=Vigna radiata var. radiata TaxID=3916 RepID=A0A1S3VDJ2_VIGRR|nr:FT-interacting protein 1 [Vigna radiata var. radiata]
MSNLKLGVEVVGAHDLMPKDGQGSCSTYVELQFDGQKFRTSTKEKDLSPVWNEKFYFNVTDPNKLQTLTLDAFVYHYSKSNNSKLFLGKVHLTGPSFVPYSDAVVLHYPLEKKNVFSRIKGELGLKVFVTDDPSVKSSHPLHEVEPSADAVQRSTPDHSPVSFTNSILNVFSRKKNDTRHTFHNLPNSNEEKQHKSSSSESAKAGVVDHGKHETKSALPPPRVFHAYPGLSSPMDYALKETSPYLGGGQVVGGRVKRGYGPASSYDLVEPMQYLFVRVVKARDLPSKGVTGGLDPYVEVKVGNFKGVTKHYEKTQDPEWNQVFAFARENQQSTSLEVVVKDKNMLLDGVVGSVRFDLHDVPTRVPPNSPLAPEWYRLDKGKDKKKGELMLAVWFGTQADEAFPDAWHSDALTPSELSSSAYAHMRSKVYHSPRLWYLRVKVIEAQDLHASENSQIHDAYVKLQIGNQILRTKPVQSRSMALRWDQELMFVAAEPFDEHLIVSVENRVGPDKDETIGVVAIPLSQADKRADDRGIHSRWYHLEESMSSAMDGEHEKKEKDKFFSRIHLSVCLDGGYHVFDGSTYYSSDLRATSKQLWKKPIGVLEIGILSVHGLHPMKTRDGRGTTDTYCVAKYGHKWVRTRTISDSLSPKYNEQYTWEVYDPATVLTVGVFDNGQLSNPDGNKDLIVGKVRIRISTLEAGRVYTNVYPLLVLHPSGVKKMGELHLAIRFSCFSMVDLMQLYFKPHLPKMHYKRPLNIMEQEKLRHQAVNVVAARLSRAEPPLRKEVVEYMSDTDSHLWSMRRSKANFYRLMTVFSGVLSVVRWLGEVSTWKHPITTVLVHVLFLMLVCFPELLLPTVFLYMFVIGMWNWRFRPRCPPHMNTRLSYAEAVSPDELDEEFDTFPSSKGADVIRWRYDRLRSVAGRIQSVVGDLATQGERIQALVNWRDPRATTMFMVFCFVSAIVLYVTPFQLPILLTGFYLMRHPMLRSKVPPAPVNFFRRLPALTDSML